jgi:hypothetical protein
MTHNDEVTGRPAVNTFDVVPVFFDSFADATRVPFAAGVDDELECCLADPELLVGAGVLDGSDVGSVVGDDSGDLCHRSGLADDADAESEQLFPGRELVG